MTELLSIGPNLMPDTTPEFMFPAWLGCMRWAIGEEEIRQAFEQDSGMMWPSPRLPFARMVDEAMGYHPCAEYIRRFIEWANANVWGDVDAEVDQ